MLPNIPPPTPSPSFVPEPDASPAIKLAFAIEQVIRECNIQDNVYGVTNYMDMRLVHLMNHLAEHNINLRTEHKELLAQSLSGFLDSLDADESYFLKGSGTYDLKIKLDKLQLLSRFLNS